MTSASRNTSVLATMYHQAIMLVFCAVVLLTTLSNAAKVSGMADGADIKFEITPKTFKPRLTDNLIMRCGITSATSPPSSIVITKDGVRLAAVSSQSPASYFGNSSDVKVTSQLSGNSSFIQLVFNDPSCHQSGSYQCDVALLDQRGHHHDVSKTANVTSDAVTFEDLIDEIHELNKQKEQLNNVTDLLQNVIQSKDKTNKDLMNVIQSNDKTNKDLMRRMEVMEQKVNKVNKHVYFSAGVNFMNQVFKSKAIFAKVFTNIGGGFNRTTGTFTCPEAGDYMFFVNVRSLLDKKAELMLMHNDVPVIHLQADDNLDYQSASNSVIISLAKGDTIYLKPDLHPAHVFGYWYPATTFTGVLLSPA